MKRMAITLGTLALALSSCGLIPPITLTDPLGLDGKEYKVSLNAAAQAVASFDQTYTFADQSFEVPIIPSSFSVAVGFREVRFDNKACSAKNNPPQSIDIAIKKLSIDLADVASPSSGQKAVFSDFNFTATRNATGGYDVSGDVKLPEALFASVPSVIKILKEGGENQTRVAFDVNTTSNPDLAGCDVILVFNGGTGKLKL
jgi:hypothetical protein